MNWPLFFLDFVIFFVAVILGVALGYRRCNEGWMTWMDEGYERLDRLLTIPGRTITVDDYREIFGEGENPA